MTILRPVSFARRPNANLSCHATYIMPQLDRCLHTLVAPNAVANDFAPTMTMKTFVHELLTTLLGPILWAAPKKKTSHSKKRMRSANKQLQDRKNIQPCHACGRPKLMHHICEHCYKDFRRKHWIERTQQVTEKDPVKVDNKSKHEEDLYWDLD
jgi:ribosomal protein L32